MSTTTERMKVIITANDDRRGIIELIQKGGEYYATRSGTPLHYSYHKSGRTHLAFQHKGIGKYQIEPYTEYCDIEKKKPLEKIEHFQTLATFDFAPKAIWHTNNSLFKKYKGSEVDHLITLNAYDFAEADQIRIVAGVAPNIDNANEKVLELTYKYRASLHTKYFVERENSPVMVILIFVDKNLYLRQPTAATGGGTIGNQIVILSPEGGFEEKRKPYHLSLPGRVYIEPTQAMQRAVISVWCDINGSAVANIFDLDITVLFCDVEIFAPTLILPLGMTKTLPKTELVACMSAPLTYSLTTGEFRIFDLWHKEHSFDQVEIHGNKYQITILESRFDRLYYIFPAKSIYCQRRTYEVEVIKLN